MIAIDPVRTSHFAKILARREQELCAILNAGEPTETGTYGPQGHEVMDFKDMAAEQTAASIDAAKAEHAAHELEQVLAARRRLQDHSYGLCVDCGEEIDPRRLEALPATPYCTGCQAVHEYAYSAARR